MIVAMLRVKNEARWIEEVLVALKPCCDALYVFDDHSEDETLDIASSCGAHVMESPFDGIDESRDKDRLLEWIRGEVEIGSWVLCIDGDEVLEPAGPGKIKELALGAHDAYQFRILYLWNDRYTVRTDGVYGRFFRPSMFRLADGQSFRRTGAHANLHCSSVPASLVGKVRQSDVSLLHLGYMDRADRIRKYEWYKSIDPDNSCEDGYRHVVIGDLFSPQSRFLHAGPLKLESVCKPLAR